MHIILYLTRQASPDATTELPDDPHAAARGRNGWFCPRQITIWRGERVWIAVRSRRMGEHAPLQLRIAPAAAHALGGALLLAAAESVTRQALCTRSRSRSNGTPITVAAISTTPASSPLSRCLSTPAPT